MFVLFQKYSTGLYFYYMQKQYLPIVVGGCLHSSKFIWSYKIPDKRVAGGLTYMFGSHLKKTDVYLWRRMWLTSQ